MKYSKYPNIVSSKKLWTFPSLKESIAMFKMLYFLQQPISNVKINVPCPRASAIILNALKIAAFIQYWLVGF